MVLSSCLQSAAEVEPDLILASFFSESNAFKNPLAEGDRVGDVVPHALQPSIRRYAKGFKDRPCLLPFREHPGDRICWFACAHDEIHSRELQDELIAFVGPSFGAFELYGLQLTSPQIRTKELLVGANLRVIVFHSINSSNDGQIVKSWENYWNLLDRRPPRPQQELRTFKQLRAAFDRALVARNEKDAQLTMTAMRDQHGLSAENKVFLEIRLYAAFSKWNSILEHPQLMDVLELRLPPETYGDIWDALYETYLVSYELRGSASDLIAVFEQQVRNIAGALLKSRGRSRRPASIKGFLLHELSLSTPSARLCIDLLTELELDAFGNASPEIADLVSRLSPAYGFENAIREMELERYEQAYLVLKTLPDSIQSFQAQLRCVKEIAQPELADELLRRLEASSKIVADAVYTSRARLLNSVKLLAGDLVREEADEKFELPTSQHEVDNVLIYWRELVNSPQASENLKQPSFIETLVAAIEDMALDSSLNFESVIPIWFDWLIIRTPPSSSLIRVYLGFIEALHARNRSGDTEREMTRLATRHALIAGLTPMEYLSLVNRLSTILTDAPSPRETSWALEMADLFVVEPCRDEEARLGWVTRAINAGVQAYNRLDTTDRSVLRLLAQEFDLFVPLDSANEIDDEDKANVVIAPRILLYSLDSLAIQRAARVLSSVFPDSRIDCNSDQTCTTRLRVGSSHADWVVFVSSVATHQAFFCIKAALRKNAELLQVEGTGTTRIVDRVISQSQSAPTLR